MTITTGNAPRGLGGYAEKLDRRMAEEKRQAGEKSASADRERGRQAEFMRSFKKGQAERDERGPAFAFHPPCKE
jgi:hypothetical protein